MTLDVVNGRNEKVGSVELSDEVFGSAKKDLIWASVVRQNASERSGTHSTKTRAEVSGSGKKPWRQKGTGRARVGEIRNPLWRKGGIVFGPKPRSYDFALPRKVERAALRSAFALRLQDGLVTVVEALAVEAAKTKAAAALLQQIGVAPGSKTLVVDVKPDPSALRAMRNLAGVRLVASGSLTARDVMDAKRLVVTQAAIERLHDLFSGRLATGNQEPGTGSQEPGTGNREPGTGDQGPGTGDRDRGPGAGDQGPGVERKRGRS
jgi:large subunit ribosomal protein L4